MKIEITRSGGFAGLTRTWSLEVSRSEAEERWIPLAAQANPSSGTSSDISSDCDDQPGAAPATAHRDRFTYSIVIGYTEVRFPESQLEDPWRELIDRARTATSAAGRPAPDAPPGEGTGPGPSRELL